MTSRLAPCILAFGRIAAVAPCARALGLKRITMSLKDFWMSVRTGARFIAPRATADSPRLDSAAIESTLRRATIWLTPKSVEGFNPEDFLFLSDHEQKTLRDAVSKFLVLARQVPPGRPATEQQIQQALPLFLRIVEILRPDHFADSEAFVIGKKVEQQLAGQIPQSVLELRFETGKDASGGPALWIWVVFKDEAAKKDVFLPNARNVRELLENSVSELGFEQWPYVRFRTDSELKPSEQKSKK